MKELDDITGAVAAGIPRLRIGSRTVKEPPLSVNPNSYEVSGTEPLRFGFQFHLNIRVASCFDER